LTARPRSLAWDATSAIEALAAADTALWVWTPSQDQLRFTGATRVLGLGPLAPECSGAGFVASTLPQDRSLAEKMLKPQDEGTEVAVRLRMRGSDTCMWRGVWLEDGLRAAGVVALETKFAGSDRDALTGLLDRRAFITRVGEVLTQAGEYEIVVGDVDRLRRLNEALGHERTDLVLSALGSRLAAAFSKEASPARIGEDEFAVIVQKTASHASFRLRRRWSSRCGSRASTSIRPSPSGPWWSRAGRTRRTPPSCCAGSNWRSNRPRAPGAADRPPMAGRWRATA